MLNVLIYSMIWLKKHYIPFLPGVISRLIRLIFCMEIRPTATFGKNIILNHNGLGCVFHENVIIGDNVNIYQNVTLGGKGNKKPTGYNCPIIMEGATIYAGACVLGPITIGKNSEVGANAVVLEDVPDNCIAVGVPARIIKKQVDDKR